MIKKEKIMIAVEEEIQAVQKLMKIEFVFFCICSLIFIFIFGQKKISDLYLIFASLFIISIISIFYFIGYSRIQNTPKMIITSQEIDYAFFLKKRIWPMWYYPGLFFSFSPILKINRKNVLKIYNTNIFRTKKKNTFNDIVTFLPRIVLIIETTKGTYIFRFKEKTNNIFNILKKFGWPCSANDNIITLF